MMVWGLRAPAQMAVCLQVVEIQLHYQQVAGGDAPTRLTDRVCVEVVGGLRCFPPGLHHTLLDLQASLHYAALNVKQPALNLHRLICIQRMIKP